MAMLKRRILSLITSAALLICGGCGSIACASSLDNTLYGYGQGRQVDDNNCPIGAIDFNSTYVCYDAQAVTNGKNIILTFDQGYENGYTEKILDTLKEKNVKAVFFLTGDYAKKCGSIVKRMIDEGHIIGNHGMRHASLPKLDEAGMREEILSLHDYVRDTYGYEMKYFRPPCGEYSQQALAEIQKCGYKTLLWSFAYCDWDVNDQPPAADALERVTGAAHEGAIYLLHSVSATNCEILPQVIDSLRSEGYTFGLPE